MVSPSSHAVETILKVDCEGDLRRALLKGTPTYSAIDRAIQEIWPQRLSHEAKYLDVDNDACTLTEQTLTDFLRCAKMTSRGKVLRLLLSKAPPPSSDNAADVDKAPSATDCFAMPWQHVEHSDETGDQGLHTVADLTDMQDGEDYVLQSAENGSPALASTCLAPECQNFFIDSEFEDAEEEISVESEFEEVEEPSPPSPPPESEFEETEEASTWQETVTVGVEGGLHDNAQRDHGALEMVDIVIAAFDESGDAHLNFAESNAVQKAACDGRISLEAFQQMCADWGEDPEVGLGREALACIYKSCREDSEALHMDFQAAKQKLQGFAPEKIVRDYNQHRSTVSPSSLFLPRSGNEVASRILGHAQQFRCCLGSRIRTFL